MSKVLVTYATRTGSTQGVAQAIGETLQELGRQLDILPMNAVNTLTDYHAVVAGSAIQSQMWLPEAVDFIKANQTELKQKPFAMFSVCMTLALKKGEQYRSDISAWLRPVRSIVHPTSEALFAGALDIARIPKFSDRIKFRISVAAGVWTEGDDRDWDAIQAWARELHPLMGTLQGG